MDLREELNIIFNPDIPLTEAPLFMECGKACNSFLGGGADIRSTSGMIKGAVIGAALGVATGGVASAPLAVGGAMIGQNRPMNSLHTLCRAKCKYEKLKKMKDPKAQVQKFKVREKEQKVKNWIIKFKNKNEPHKAAVMQKALRMIMGKRF